MIEVEELESREAPSVFDYKDWIRQKLQEVKLILPEVVKTAKPSSPQIISVRLPAVATVKAVQLQNVRDFAKSMEAYFVRDGNFTKTLGIGDRLLDDYFVLSGKMANVEGAGVVPIM